MSEPEIQDGSDTPPPHPRGHGHRSTFLWMGALSVITLLLGVLRELVIARDLRASGSADLFFRGLVIVNASRNFGLALYRARWIPLGSGPSALSLVRRELPTTGLLVVASLVGLGAVLGPGVWSSALTWVFAVAVTLAVLGSAVRALAERGGYERRGFVLEWALPLGTIAGALWVGHGALGPALGISSGLLVGLLALVPVVFLTQAARGHALLGPDHSGHTRWLLLDTMLYVNLGLLDASLSLYIFDEGGLALLNYAYLFVNAALAVPTAAATVVALRLAADPARARAILRRWAPLAGLLVGGAVLLVWALLGWVPVATRIDAAAGWSITAAIAPLVLASVPFAALRLANTVGRQARVAADPKGLWPWDLVGLALRTVVLVVGASWYGVLASPVALVVGELVQLGAWWAWRPATPRSR
ncbi:hypothetical protein [Paraliomyxa miuraensis]|uniref:hypothetical protein n=1 Tax=Paraliomyxa miuraensis TaxID=376150 RepID=UPI0022547AE6|nr:hypothetical protein [Paraliomyxa miuraensis]MCX4248023.1 hypothetical protein [Paraliomyxa miuraensis]